MALSQRKPQRLQDYDYSEQGAYFITLCTHNRQHLFGKLLDGTMRINKYGLIAQSHLLNIPQHFDSVVVDKFIVMPNHLHCIFILWGTAERSRPFPTLSTVVGLYKSGVTNRIHGFSPDLCVWQKSFHDHVIRDEQDYLRIWQYIDTNPLNWEKDRYFTPESSPVIIKNAAP